MVEVDVEKGAIPTWFGFHAWAWSLSHQGSNPPGIQPSSPAPRPSHPWSHQPGQTGRAVLPFFFSPCPSMDATVEGSSSSSSPPPSPLRVCLASMAAKARRPVWRRRAIR